MRMLRAASAQCRTACVKLPAFAAMDHRSVAMSWEGGVGSARGRTQAARIFRRRPTSGGSMRVSLPAAWWFFAVSQLF